MAKMEKVVPDESTILSFHHLLKKQGLAVAIFPEANAVLSEKGLSMKRGSIVDRAASSSTKNQDKQRNPKMSQTKKEKQCHFGMKAHIRFDAESVLIHTVECTTAKVLACGLEKKTELIVTIFCAPQSVYGASSIDAYDGGAPVERKVKIKTSSSRGQQAK